MPNQIVGGKWFDELEVGQVFQHAIRRTVTETDNILFTSMTHNPAQLHLDADYCEKETEFGKPLINSLFTLGLVIGISVHETTMGTAVANLGMDNVKFPKPLFAGDTIHVETEIVGLRESKSRPTQGIVTFEHRAYNQKDELVCSLQRSGLQHKKPKSD
jgi:acyl dehydratase